MNEGKAPREEPKSFVGEGEEPTDEAVRELNIRVVKDRVPPDRDLPVTFTDATLWGCLTGLLFFLGVPLAAAGVFFLWRAGEIAISGIILLVLGLPLIAGGLWFWLFPPRREFKLSSEGVSFHAIGGMGGESWTEPLNAYRGVVASLDGPRNFDDPGPGSGCGLEVTLEHGSDNDKNVKLFEAMALYPQGQPPPEEVRQSFAEAHERYVELFGLSALTGDGDERIVEVPSG